MYPFYENVIMKYILFMKTSLRNIFFLSSYENFIMNFLNKKVLMKPLFSKLFRFYEI